MCVSADVKSAKATAMQARVLGRVRTEIERQVQAVNGALRQLEDAFMLDHNAQLQGQLFANWTRTREHRDECLVFLDQVSIHVYYATDDKSEGNDMSDTATNKMVDTLAKLKMQHSEMQKMEQKMAAAMLRRDWTPLMGQLYKLRQQRVQRPRILCSHGVSSRTGQGLDALRRALAGLMEDTRLFAHVGAKVPLNYSMLERLAHEGCKKGRQQSIPVLYRGAVKIKLDTNSRTIFFRQYGTFRSVRSRQQCPVGRKAYYELEVLTNSNSKRNSNLQFGFASTALTLQLGSLKEKVEDDAVLWSVNGADQIAWNRGEKQAYECKWKRGDVIGLACDLQAMQMLVSVNGSFAPPNGCVLDIAPDAVHTGLRAAFGCLGYGTIGYNLGEAPFKYDPPAADYCAFAEFALHLVRASVLFSTHV